MVNGLTFNAQLIVKVSVFSPLQSLINQPSGLGGTPSRRCPAGPRRGRPASSACRCLARALAWIIKRANLSQSSIDNKAQIHNMIHTVNRLHVEDGRDIVAIDYVLLYFYTLDERKMLVRKPTIVSRPASFGINGPSNVMSGAKGTDERSLLARPFK